MNVLLSRNPDATKVAEIPLRFWRPLLSSATESAAYVLGRVGCQAWVLIVTLLTQSGEKLGQESLSSMKCVVPRRRPTSEHGGETDVWTFAVKLSWTVLPRGRGGGGSQTLIAMLCQLQSRGVKSGWLSIKSKSKKMLLCVPVESNNSRCVSAQALVRGCAASKLARDH